MPSPALFAAVLATFLATPALASPDPTAAWVDRQCRTHGADPKNPWALAHAVGAYGASFKAADGRLAIDVMVADFLERKTVGGRAVWTFPEKRDGLPVEPHKNHQLMTLLRAGVPLSHVFAGKDFELTLKELVAQAKETLAFDGSEAFYRLEPWTLDALAAVTSEASPLFQGAGGQKIDLGKALDGEVTYLESQQRFLEEARRSGEKVAKRKQLIWSQPCGGFHLFQSAFAWMDQKGFAARHAKDLAAQVEILLYRLEVETAIYQDALTQAPKYAVQLNTQRLKFYGHFLETVGRLQTLNAWPKSVEHDRAVANAKRLLASAVEGLEKDHVSTRMDELKASMPQVYLDLIGDSCHAVTGLRAK